MEKSLWYLGVAIVLSLNYASAFVISITWNINLIYSIPLIFTISLIIGALIADLRNTIICAVISMTVGVAIATAIISGPPIVYSGSFAEIQTIFALTLNSVAKMLILNITAFVAGVFVGNFLGER